jgi:hypothetical protein
VEVGEELAVHKVAQIVAGQGLVVVELAVLALGCGPVLPAIGLVEDERVFLPFQSGFHGLVLFQSVKIFQKEEPGALLSVVQLAGATGLFPENVIDVFEGLFEHWVVLDGSYEFGGRCHMCDR